METVNNFKKYSKSVLNERTIFQIDKDKIIDKRIVNRANIGSIFRLFGFTKYPNYEDFEKANFIIECNLTNTYKGWLSKPKVNLLKVLHLIAILNQQFTLLKVPNSKLASMSIENKYIPNLVKMFFNSDPLGVYDKNPSNALEYILLKESSILGDKYDTNTDLDLTVTLKDFNDNSKVGYYHNGLPKEKAILNDFDYSKLINIKGITNNKDENKEIEGEKAIPTPNYFSNPFPNIENVKARNKIISRIEKFYKKNHNTDPKTWGIIPEYLESYVKTMRDDFKDLTVSAIIDPDNFILENKNKTYYVFTSDGNVFTADNFDKANEFIMKRISRKNKSVNNEMPEDVEEALNEMNKA